MVEPNQNPGFVVVGEPNASVWEPYPRAAEPLTAMGRVNLLKAAAMGPPATERATDFSAVTVVWYSVDIMQLFHTNLNWAVFRLLVRGSRLLAKAKPQPRDFFFVH